MCFLPDWTMEPWRDRTHGRPDASWLGRRALIRPRIGFCRQVARLPPERDRVLLHYVLGGIGFTHHLICGAVVGKVRDEDRAFVVDCGVPVSVFLPPGMSPNEGEMIEVTGRLDATLIREMDPLFTLPAEYRELLEMPPGSNSRLLENQLIKEFERHGISLGGPVWVSITGDGKEFRVDASESREFFIVETARDLAVYPPP
jgi:hypothetical protein